MMSHDGVQCCIDILGHARSITTHVHVRSVVQPAPEFRTALLHTILHVDLLFLIAGERSVEASQIPGCMHPAKFFLVQEVALRAALAEEEPVASFMPKLPALMQEPAERSDACTWADHNNRCISIYRQSKTLVRLDVDGQ